MRAQCADLRSVKLIEGAGHSVQQERPAEVKRRTAGISGYGPRLIARTVKKG